MAAALQRISGYPSDYASGHFVVIGATGSGKTFYCKACLIKSFSERCRQAGKVDAKGDVPVFIFVGGASAHDWTDPEADGSTLVAADHVYTTWTDEGHAAVLKSCEEAGCGFWVFDDFKSVINFHTDKRFLDLFRVMRHMGVQVLAIGHTPHDVPPLVRDNATHIILFFTSNLEAIRDLAQTYLAGDTPALREAMRQIQGHTVLKINVRQNTRHLHSAPSPAEAGVGTSDVGLGGELPIGSAPGVELGAVGISARTVDVSGGTYNDASTTNQVLQLNQNIEAQVRQNAVTYNDIRARAAINREIDEARVTHQARIKLLEEREELKGHLLNPWLTGADRDRAALLLARSLGDTTITQHNMFRDGRDVVYMQAHHPEVDYQPRADALATASSFATLAVAVAGGDRAALVGEAFKAMAPSAITYASGRAEVKNSPGFSSLLGGAAPASAKNTVTAAARARARRLIVARPGRRDGWPPAGRAELIAALRPTLKRPSAVDEKTYVGYALDLLKEFYPADFADERRLWDARARN